MGKFLLWAVIILAALLISRILAHQKAQARRAQSDPASRAGQRAAETMVRCAHCHIHLPRSEAFFSQGKTWCSAEHARMGLKK